MSESPLPLKSDGTGALTVVTPPLWVTSPWITPLLVKPPLNFTLPLSTLIVPPLMKFEVTSLTPPPPVFSNRPSLMKAECRRASNSVVGDDIVGAGIGQRIRRPR